MTFTINLGTPSPKKYPCPPGTFSNSSSLYDESQCTDCPLKYYCQGGEAGTSGLCPPGFYCKIKTKFAKEFACPNGTYNSEFGKSSINDCKTCPLGHFCEKGTVQPYECPIGTYMPYGFNKTSMLQLGNSAGFQNECLTCPAGFFCLNATVTPKKCGFGKYSKLGQSLCQVSNFNFSYDNIKNFMSCNCLFINHASINLFIV